MKCEVTVDHSAFLKIFGAILIGFLIIFGSMGEARAQMFSVGSQGPRYNIPQTELYLGLEPMDVTYKGGSMNSQLHPGAFEFSGSVLRLGYNSSGLNLFLGTGGKITGIDNVSYFDIGGNIDIGLMLERSKTFVLQIPIRIASRYTNMANDNVITSRYSRFKFGDLTGGAGLRLMVRPSNDIRIEVLGIPSYGAAFASGGFFGGSVGSIAAEGHLYFDHLFGNIGLSFGYKYDYRNYDVDENVYDYKISGNNIEVGITF